MRRLSLIILLILAVSGRLWSQKSPHGEGFALSCKDCHTTDSWKIDLDRLSFDHSATRFPLQGQHQAVSCKDCHTSLEFGKTPTDCNECHIDIHEQTVGTDCSRCHTPNSWVVTNTTQLHQLSRFPLIGPHTQASCSDCHTNLSPAANGKGTASLLRFDPLGIECYDCHKDNYLASTNPNHTQANYSTNCVECHNINSYTWTGAGINHNFFPLTGGHAINDCKTCHTSGTYASIDAACISCHQPDYNSTNNPNHSTLQFSTDCKACHDLSPGWKPALYRDHDSRFFPIYSGNHNGEWDNCSDCHTNPSNYAQFSCINCHEHNQGDTDDEHEGVSGYQYNSTACYGCHPNGSGEGAFDHNSTSFPLTGAHTSTTCSSCHTSGYAGTSTSCSSCHTNAYTQTTNPNHSAAGISTECANCHTTNPGWKPASYADHNNVYPLLGAHQAIANDCFSCHAGNYSNTPNTCYGCHATDYNQSTDPSHTAAQFPTTCEDCHSVNAWKPSTFNHDGQYFPIYSGSHNGEWNSCSECHTNPGNFAVFSCIDCHEHNQADMDDEHQDVGGYTYNSIACFECHPSGNSQGSFNHNTSAFPLTGGHALDDCSSCHANGYSGTSTVCASCHTNNYNQTTNPNHTGIGISNDCAACHTTGPGWSPAAFPTHSNYYVLEGAHAGIGNDCASCHNGNYTNTPATCSGCHIDEYNQTNNPSHSSAQFPTTCDDCHSQASWTPANFNHDGQYFPIYSGEHQGEWDQCSDCHINPGNYAVVTCTSSCHPQNATNNEHQGVGGYVYTTEACLACHPDGNSAGSFNHNTSPFPLTGGHAGADCSSCHANGYSGTPSDCASCHINNYNQSTNPGHISLNLSTDCAACHTTNPGWAPASFAVHNNYYVLEGAHAAISEQCADCHNGDYNNTPNTCSGCHIDNYNQTTNPNHAASQFATTCEDCHTQTAWVPSTFDHDLSYPLTGAHATIASNCTQCHPNGYNNTPNTCEGCHMNNYNQSVNPNHVSLAIPNECATCHTTNPGWAPATFPIHNNYYVLEGAHVAIADQCATCHNGDYNNTPNTCSGCHIDNYNQTTNPNHAASQFATTCEDCHTQTAWVPSTFDHNTAYPLSGAHATIAGNCTQCHPNGYNNTPNTCEGCHQNNYNQATNPNHVSLAIPNECATCHTTNPGWAPASFPIHNNYYVLQGAHLSIADQCSDCHNGNYNSTPNTCSGCHINEYNQTNNPNHSAAQYPTTCEDCHTQSVWMPSTFDHDAQYFPIYSGNHNGEWSTCSDCHPNPGDFAVFTCTTSCHPQSSTNNDHQGVSGYSYNSIACLNCHPNGNDQMIRKMIRNN